MSEAKKRLVLPSKVSPVGIAKYTWVTKPDTGYDGKSEPKFKTRIIIEDNAENRAWCEAIMTEAQAFAKANNIKLKKVFAAPFRFPEDQDEDDFIPAEGKDKPKLDEDHRGAIYFETKTGFKPGLIDAARTTLPEDVFIMSGDRIRVKFELNPYEGLGSGVSFRLQTVQLVQKNTSFAGKHSVNTDGFDDIEGYTAPDGVEQF